MYHSMQVHYYICYNMLSNYTIKMQFKGDLHPVMPDILFFLISRYFYNLNLKYVHIHSYKVKIKIKNSSRGCVTPPNIPKLGVSDVKDTANTNKD